jgi:hypothetical protein
MGSGIVLPNLVFAMTERLIVVRRTDCNDTPHLTISFKNTSGEIDIHLKHESSRNDKSSTYTPILRLPKKSLELYLEPFLAKAGVEIAKVYLNSAKKIRPGWLWRNGYVIALGDSQAFEASIYECAPKKQGKYRVDSEKLRDLFTNAESSKINLHHPSVLHTSVAKSHGEPIYAVRSSKKRQIIPLLYARWKDRKSWVTFEKLPTKIEKVFLEHTPPPLREKLKETWCIIFDSLRLNELGLTRD